jgi:uncharacterized spore protein YtfJ
LLLFSAGQFEKGVIQMSDVVNNIIAGTTKGQERSFELMEKLLAVAQPGSVFSQPVQSGNYTVITASELVAGIGFGYGVGGGGAPSTAKPESGDESRSPAGEGSGGGGGGGGGGMSTGRPVAVVTLGPEGVQVKPVVDVTKLGLAALTTLGAMYLTLGRMRRFSRP